MSPQPLWACLAIGLCACGGEPARGEVVVAVTVDWEGAYVTPENVAALAELRGALGDAPITHFVSAAYFTKPRPDPELTAALRAAVRDGDELAVHLHAWRSLARAASVEPRLSPSFLNGTEKVTVFDDGDRGFDTDLDAYDATALRRLVRTSRDLLAATGLPVSTSFRAGGYLGSPRVLQAIRDEGFTVDSSAIAPAQVVAEGGALWAGRLDEIWPSVTPAPFAIELRGGALVELPIAAVADYVDEAGIVAAVEAAGATLAAAPERDVVVVLALHHETATDFAARVTGAISTLRARPGLRLRFVTVEDAAARVHLHGG